MLTDIQISQAADIQPIEYIAEKMGFMKDELELYGKFKAKVKYNNYGYKQGKLILVTAINPTPLGEGKTTMSIGLADGLRKIGEDAVLCLREPSLGPVFGIKGGAAGGGYSQVIPMEDINLHFTGDLHAIESANNLLAAMIDNHIFQGNELGIKTVTWRRCMDMNDRQLRNIESGLGGKMSGVPRADGFDITVASEVMAIFCLAKDMTDLQTRLGNIIVGYDEAGAAIHACDLKAEGAMCALLRDAFNPNIVQTLEGTPAIIHGGPFANIAHGCNSLVATKLALSRADYVVTEAGFGADLGAEKFLDIKCRIGELNPNVVVLVATTKALKYNGGVPKDEVKKPNIEALQKGLCNLQRHIKNLKGFGVPVVVAINKFDTDTEEEIQYIKLALNTRCVTCSSFAEGGAGAEDLARAVLANIEENTSVEFTYGLADSIFDKITAVARTIYGASGIRLSEKATESLLKIESLGFENLPVCIAKTQYSFSDDATKLGAPEDFILEVADIRLSAGAGFVVVICGKIMTMPGLPKTPAAQNIKVGANNNIIGLF